MKAPLIIDRNKNEARLVGFQSGMLGSSIEQPLRHEFKSNDPHEQTVELCELVNQHYEGTSGIYINYPADKLLIREFVLPFVDKKKVKELVPYELEALLPYELDEMVYDYFVYHDLEEEKSRIIAMAGRSDIIREEIQIFKENRILLRGVYVSPDALFRLAQFVELEDFFLLFVSGGFSMMTTVKNNELSYTRIIPLGYESLLKWLTENWKKSQGESEQLLSNIANAGLEDVDYSFYKKHFQLTRPQSKLILQTISDFGEELVDEIEKTVLLTESDTESSLPVLIVSDTGNQSLIERLLLGKTSGPLDSFPYEKTMIGTIGREFSLSLGASRAISSNHYINLLTPRLKKEAKFKTGAGLWKPALAVVAGALLYLGSFTFDYFQQLNFVNQAQLRQNESFQKYFGREPLPDTSVIDQARVELNKEEQRTEIQRILLSKPKLGPIFLDLTEALAGVYDFQLSKLEYSKETVRITASTDSFESHNQIKQALIQHKGFAKVIAKDSRKMISGNNISRIEFTFEITPAVEGGS